MTKDLTTHQERERAQAAAVEFFEGRYDCYAPTIQSDDDMPTTCGWLVERPSNNPEPDSYADTITIGECGDGPVDERGLCGYHAAAMDLPLDEYERISEAHDGNAFS